MPLRNIPPCPPSLKPIQHYLKTAAEHDERDIVIAYWCRLYALQLGLKIDKSSLEAKKLLGFLMDWLEKTKVEQNDNEAICNDIPAQAHLENYALRLFVWADSQDRGGFFNKNVVKAFYTAGMIYDVLDTFGEAPEEVQKNRKYAKWKAAYIHNCLKNGEIPVPGPVIGENENDNLYEPSSSSTTPRKFRPSPPTDVDESTSDFPFLPPVSGTFPPETPSKAKTSDNSAKSRTSDNSAKPELRLSFKSGERSTDKGSETEKNLGVQLSPEQINKAQKYCKWAASALTYDDVPTAINNLQKALQLLTTGVDE